MPDEDRVVAAVMDLTKQVSRAAWAVEVRVLIDGNEKKYEKTPCPCCGSQLVPVQADTCPACLEPKKEKTDG
jgi:uncharacterized OB-fold protein